MEVDLKKYIWIYLFIKKIKNKKTFFEISIIVTNI